MKLFLLSVLMAVFSGSFCFAQNSQLIDNLKHQLSIATHDTSRVLLMTDIAFNDFVSNPQSSKLYAQKALELSKKIKFSRGEAKALSIIALIIRQDGNFSESLELQFKSLKIAEENNVPLEKGYCLMRIGNIYRDEIDRNKAVNFYNRALKEYEMIHFDEGVAAVFMNLGSLYLSSNKIDSALKYSQLAFARSKMTVIPLRLQSDIFLLLGNVQDRTENTASALNYWKQGLQIAIQAKDTRTKTANYLTIAQFYNREHLYDSSIYYAEKGLVEAKQISFKRQILLANQLLAAGYESKNLQKAYNHLKEAQLANEELYGPKQVQALQKIVFEEQELQRKIEADTIAFQNQLKQYALLAGLAVTLLIGFILYRNNRQKQKANEVLGNTLTNLKVTQVQLENKNRDLEIEAALERIRSRTMAMYKSEELAEVTTLLYQQITQLGGMFDRFVIGIIDEQKRIVDIWATDQSGQQLNKHFVARLNEKTTFVKIYASWKSGQKSQVIDLQGEEFLEWLKYAREELGIQINEAQLKGRRLQNVAYFSQGYLGIQSSEPLSPEINVILERFSTVFNLTYTRFLDLQKAEAQARESQIQLAMERVRSRAMAMQTKENLTNEDLKDAAALLFQQVKALGVPAYSCGYNIWNQGEKECDSWMSTHDGSGINPAFKIPLMEEANFIQFVESKKNNESFYVIEMSGERMQEYYQYLIKTIPVFKAYFEESVKAGFPMPETQIHHIANFSYGNLMFITLEPCPEFHDVFKRFAAVFEQTYTRFLELKKAEAQAREAKIEAAMEKVRGRAMAMQKPHELVEVAQLLRKEMGLLGVEELETSSIYIHNEGAGETECWYAIKDIRGNDINLVSDHMKIHLKDTWVGSKMLAFQHSKKKQTSILMQGQHRKDWINYCAQHSRVLQGYYGDEIPERTYHLVKFSHGFIGVASPGDISNECWNLLQRATSAFSLAYTRFNDLKLAEAQAVQAHLDLIQIQTEKKRAEDTLIELRATQAQLIQKEKLASLGELTAGIAHEIQNPLNFVNNFSELSVDLAQELNEELDKEPIDKVFVKELMGDLTQNQQKINLHGKRASSIVKGMLEHSRQSTGERELTDINQLADEYLRLSYHGLRAKDSSFNCDYALIGARDLPKIEVVPQEIGRVLLNLINNAFYAVNARRAQNAADVNYSPKVVVSAQVIDNQVVIQVKDNGIGMSKEVQAKIFQPFFTTKPTGEGTGLGLSLAYDIVTKGHGGTIELESVEGEGTKFRVGLPIKQQ